MKHLLFIPARCHANQSIQNKNSLAIDGVSLYMRAIRNAQKVPEEDSRIVVSSNNLEVLEVGRIHGNASIHQRPSNLSDGMSYGIHQVVRHYVECVDYQEPDPEWIWLFQPTSPFVTEERLQQISVLINSGRVGSGSIQTITPVFHNSHWMNQRTVWAENGEWRTCFTFKNERKVRKQEKPLSYQFGNMVVTRYEDMVEQGTMFAGPSYAIPVKWWEAIDIDTMDEYHLADMVYQHYIGETQT